VQPDGQREFPDLGVLPAKPRPAGSTWVTFKPAGYPREATLSHQLTGGYVKLFLADSADQFEEQKVRFDPYLESGMGFDVAGKSLGLALDVPVIDPLNKSVAAQIAEISAALEGAKRINAVYRMIRRVAAARPPAPEPDGLGVQTADPTED
jgi:hypothetical protein